MKIKGVRYSAFDIVLGICMLGVIFITFYPIYYVAINSISDGRLVMKGAITIIPRGINFETYKFMMQDTIFWRAYGNTVIYTLLGTVINLFMTALCAYPLSVDRFQAKRLFTIMITFTMFFNGGMIPRFLVINSLGMIDTIWAVVLPGAISTWNMLIMRNNFKGIPDSLKEAAHLDGVNDIGLLFRIVLPLSMPIIATLTVFYAVAHWNSYFNALIYLNSAAKFPVQLIIRAMTIEGNMTGAVVEASATGSEVVFADSALKYSAIMLTVLPIITVYPFAQKYFTKGVLVGSVKG